MCLRTINNPLYVVQTMRKCFDKSYSKVKTIAPRTNAALASLAVGEHQGGFYPLTEFTCIASTLVQWWPLQLELVQRYSQTIVT